MSKYEPLWKYLKDNNENNYKLSFEEIKNIIGFEIDHSFLTYKKEAKDFGYEDGKISFGKGQRNGQTRAGIGCNCLICLEPGQGPVKIGDELTAYLIY